MPSSSACFDLLFITQELSSRLRSATQGEIHLFAYLGCLLSLFKGQPVAEWGYGFAGLESGSPFAPELQEAYEELERAGLVSGVDNGVFVTAAGKQRLEVFNGLHAFAGRRPFLGAACDSLLSFPVGMVRNAMSMEPGLRPAKSVGGMRPLLAMTSLEQLHEHFDGLAAVLGVSSDLLVPSTVWLTYLLNLARKHDSEVMSRTTA